MYRGGRPGAAARRSNHFMAWVCATGILGWRCVTLDTVNPVSRTPLSLPVVTVQVDGRRYLVSMLGQGVKWVRNVRAADGRVTIRKGRRHAVQLVEVPVADRPAIIKAYLAVAPGARPHIPVDMDAPLSDFEAIAFDYPVFEVLERALG
jgi:hypothetical protein